MVVTNRLRLLDVRQGPQGQVLPRLVAQVAGALAGGADLVYLREPDLGVRDLMRVVAAIRERVPDAGQRLVVRDRVDLALTLGTGVHVPERGMSVPQVRALRGGVATSLVLGRSVHAVASAEASRGASYLLAGTVKATRSKPGLTDTLGFGGLRAICAAVPETPVLGIGGLGVEDIPDLRRAGATGVAGIGLFIPSHTCTEISEWTRERVCLVKRGIDSVGRAP